MSEAHRNQLAIAVQHPTEMMCAIDSRTGTLPRTLFTQEEGHQRFTREEAALQLGRRVTGNAYQSVHWRVPAETGQFLYILKRAKTPELAEGYEWLCLDHASQRSEFEKYRIDSGALGEGAFQAVALQFLLESLGEPHARDLAINYFDRNIATQVLERIPEL